MLFSWYLVVAKYNLRGEECDIVNKFSIKLHCSNHGNNAHAAASSGRQNDSYVVLCRSSTVIHICVRYPRCAVNTVSMLIVTH